MTKDFYGRPSEPRYEPPILWRSLKATHGLMWLIAIVLYVLAVIGAPFVAWGWSVMVAAMSGNWLLFVGDWLFFPIGVAHGFGHLIGRW